MVSQKGLKGTSRPTHYHILQADFGTPAELQQLTFDLCHVAGVATKVRASKALPAKWIRLPPKLVMVAPLTPVALVGTHDRANIPGHPHRDGVQVAHPGRPWSSRGGSSPLPPLSP